jgi:hypothetical protein
MMTRGRALVLGSATGTLRGVANDVDAMAQWLAAQELVLDVRQGPDATRAGMLDGLERLIRDTRPGEAAVVYYSGHGGFVAVPPQARRFGGRIAPRAFQYLVPTDHDKQRAFRGIFRAELSAAVGALAERTSNITVILDCCHSTDMVRDDDLELKAVVEPWSEGIESHVAWLAAQGCDLERLPALRNASMVLVAACPAARKAYEYSRPLDHTRHGVLTDTLLGVATQAHDPTRVSWEAVIGRVVGRIQQTRVRQRPQVSGPATRGLFSERAHPSVGALALHVDGERWFLGGGTAVGVVAADRYGIVDPLRAGSPRAVAELVVVDVEGHVAMLAGGPEADGLEPGMMAVPMAGGPAHQRCAITGEGPLVARLHEHLAEVPGLTVVEPEDDAALAFRLIVQGSRVDVRDGDGRRMRHSWEDLTELAPALRAERIDGLVGELRSIARSAELLALARGSSGSVHHSSLDHRFEWGVVEGGEAQPLPEHGAELTVGDRIYVRIENTGHRPIHVSLLDVGVGRAVVLLNPNEPEGIDLASGDTEHFGAPELRSLVGLELSWPSDVPADGPREESLVAFISSGPLPVGTWQTRAPLDRTATRDAEPEPRRARGPVYMVRHVSFLLHPRRYER